MSGEKPMVEKKVILCAILAIALGIATIVPLEYLMAAQAQEENPNPWSNLAIPYAYWNINSSISTSTKTFLGENPNIITNIMIAQNTLKDAGARIDYYQLQVYSDQGQICNLTYYVGTAAPAKIGDYWTETGLNELLNGTFSFSLDNGYGYQWYGTNSSGGTFIYEMGGKSSTFQGLINGNLQSFNASTGVWNYNSIPNIDIGNANVLYIDVIRMASATFNGNNKTVTIENSNVIQHIVLTRTDNAFIYGTSSPNSSTIPPYNLIENKP